MQQTSGGSRNAMWAFGNNAPDGKKAPHPVRRLSKHLIQIGEVCVQLVQGIGISITSAPRRVRMVQTFFFSTSTFASRSPMPSNDR